MSNSPNQSGISQTSKKEPNWEDILAFTDRQLEALTAFFRYDFLLYGGAAGGGKSRFLRWGLVYYLWRLYKKLGIRGARVGLFCEDYPTLTDRQTTKIEVEMPASIGRIVHHEGTVNFLLTDDLGGGAIMLRNLDNPSKYQSAEFAAIGVDELTMNSYETFNILRSRLRWPGVSRPKFVGATNPGNKGHGWVKALWKDSKFPNELKSIAGQFMFVPAKASDNPYLDPGYYERLLTLPPAMAQAFAEGNWNLFAGQYFTMFDEAQDVVDILPSEIPEWQTRWGSIDWGWRHPSAVHWHTQAENRLVTTYRELMRNGLTPRALAEMIVSETHGEKITAWYLSPDAFAERTSTKTIALEIGDVFAANGMPRPTVADDNRINGCVLMAQMISTRTWKIARSCTVLIDTIPVAVHDKKKDGSIEKFEGTESMAGDDALDGARYGLQTRLGIHKKPQEVIDQEYAATIKDPVGRFFYLQKRQAERNSSKSSESRMPWEVER